MRLVSTLYPDQFPHHPYWKADSTHPAFVSRSATLDHVQSIADGGDPVDVSNLVTACWTCNRRKGDLPLTELRWSLILPRDQHWQGLTELFRPLWEAAGRPPLSETDRAWMRAVDKPGPSTTNERPTGQHPCDRNDIIRVAVTRVADRWSARQSPWRPPGTGLRQGRVGHTDVNGDPLCRAGNRGAGAEATRAGATRVARTDSGPNRDIQIGVGVYPQLDRL
jgi:hypothetical protein